VHLTSDSPGETSPIHNEGCRDNGSPCPSAVSQIGTARAVAGGQGSGRAGWRENRQARWIPVGRADEEPPGREVIADTALVARHYRVVPSPGCCGRLFAKRSPAFDCAAGHRF
jgi:hypothetical protein